MLRKIISLVLSFGLLFQQVSFAQVAAELNIANYLSGIGSNIAQDKFRPLHLRYFSYDSLKDNFKILLDKGDLKKLKNSELENSTKTLLSYFLIGVTLPDNMFWVNLRPDSEDQIIDNYLEKTDVGRIMLEADLQLKKDTAIMTSPATSEGREYWDRLYKKAAELYGYDNVTIPTLTRPWIVPGEIIVRETKDSAYIYKANLKVMLEQDYLKDSTTYSFKDERSKALNEYSSQLIRELIIPKLTKEVNSNKRYAALRQVYYSLILSRWFKLRFTGKTGTYASLINTSNLTNLTSQESWTKTTYFKQYQKSFQDGEYNIKKPIYTPTGQVIRSYFSGGINVTSSAINTQNGIILPNDNANKLGDVIGGKAVVDPQSINLQLSVVSSPVIPPILKDHQNYLSYSEMVNSYSNDKNNKKVLLEREVEPARKKFHQDTLVAEPFNGNTVIVNFNSNTNDKLKGIKQKIKKSLEEDGLNSKVAFVQDNSFHLTIYDLVNPDDLSRIRSEEPEYGNKTDDEIRTIVIQKTSEAFQELKNEGKLDSIMLKVSQLGTFAPFLLLALAYPNSDEDLIKINAIRQKIFEKTKIRAPYPFVAHVTLGYIVNPMDEKEYAAYKEIVNAGMKDMNFKISIDFRKMELSNFPNMNEYDKVFEAENAILSGKNIGAVDIVNEMNGVLTRKQTQERASSPVKKELLNNQLNETMQLIRSKYYHKDGAIREAVKFIAQQGDTTLKQEVIDIMFQYMDRGVEYDTSDWEHFDQIWQRQAEAEEEERVNISFAIEMIQLIGGNTAITKLEDLAAKWLNAIGSDKKKRHKVLEALQDLGSQAGNKLYALALQKGGLTYEYLQKALTGHPRYLYLDSKLKGFWRMPYYPVGSLYIKADDSSSYVITSPAYQSTYQWSIKVSSDGLIKVDMSLRIMDEYTPVKLLSEIMKALGQPQDVLKREIISTNQEYIRILQQGGLTYEYLQKALAQCTPQHGEHDDYYVVGNIAIFSNPWGKIKFYTILNADKNMLNVDGLDYWGNINVFADGLIRVNMGLEEMNKLTPDRILNEIRGALGVPSIASHQLKDEELSKKLNEAIQLIHSSYYNKNNSIREAVKIIAEQGDNTLKQDVVDIMLQLANKIVEADTSDWEHFDQIWQRQAEAEEEERVNISFAIEMIQLIGGNITITKLEEFIRSMPSNIESMRKSKALEAVQALKIANLKNKESSSPVNSTIPRKTGGIDFRTLPMTVQQMGSFNGLNFRLPQLNQAELNQINIDLEMQQIKNMVQSGTIPSGERIKELIAACVQKKEMNSQVDNLLLCLADIFKIEEENASESSPELKEALVIVDSQS